jgi:hypothetical protein
MSQYNETGIKTFTASGAITANTLVKLSSAGVVATAGLAEAPIGVALETVATTKDVAVKLLNTQGTVKIMTDDAVTVGALVYGQASGKCDDASGSSAVIIGRALEAATADGDIIEVIPFLRQS